jgi:DNA repair exonuclease SbcCD ATPase subunit
MIRKLTIKGFKGHDGAFEFGPGINKVRGANEAGKSTLKDAINFIFWGTDAQFSNSTDHLISNGQESCEVVLETAKSTMVRRKRRGQTSQFKASINGAPFIEMSQTDLETRVQTLDRDLFTSCWLAGYFTTLDGEGRMQVFSKMGTLDRRELLMKELPPGFVLPSNVKLQELAVDLSVVQTERKKLQNILKSDEGALNEVQIAINTLSDAEELNEAQVTEELNDLEAKQEILAKYESDLQKYNDYLARVAAEQERAQSDEKRRFEAMGTIQKAADYTSETEGFISSRKKQIDGAMEDVERLRAMIQPMPVAPVKPNVSSEGHCPACLQSISAQHVQAIAGAYETQLMEYNKLCADINMANNDCRAQIDNHKKNIEAANAWIEEAQAGLINSNKNRVRAELELSSIAEEQERRKKVRKVSPPAKPEGIGSKEQLKEAFTSKSAALQRYRLKKANIEAQMERKRLLESSMQVKRETAERLYLLEKKLEYLPTLEAEAMAKSLSIRDGKLSVEKFKRKVNGQLVDRGELLVFDEKGVDYRSLSSGRQMRLDVELCHKIRELAGPRAPRMMFVDNWDLMDREVKPVPGLQIIVSAVDPTVRGVQIDRLD